MVRLLAVFAVTLVVVPSAHAQKHFVGLTGGATLSNLSETSSGSRWGGTAGVVWGYRNFNWSVLSIEGTWTQKGDGGIRLDYIDVPVLFGAAARIGSNDLRSRFYAGIAVGFKIGCSTDAGVVGSVACDNAKSTVWGLPFGVQIGKWKAGGTFVAVDVRYTLGLGFAFANSSASHRGWTFKLVLGRSVGR